MGLIYEGILMGLGLSFLIGPIFFALIQTGIEQGFRAGIAYCTGVWASDTLMIFGIHIGISYITSLTQKTGFNTTVGLIGGIILIAFGLSSFFSKSPDFDGKQTIKSSSYPALWLKGFVINSFNPGSIIFWLAITSTVVVPNNMDGGDSSLYFGSLLSALVVTDTLKVLLAKRLRSSLKHTHIVLLRRVAGVALLIFGIVLIGKAI